MHERIPRFLAWSEFSMVWTPCEAGAALSPAPQFQLAASRNNPCLLMYVARYVCVSCVTEDPHTQGGSAAHITTNGGGRPGSQNAGVAEHPLRGQPCANVSDAHLLVGWWSGTNVVARSVIISTTARLQPHGRSSERRRQSQP